MDNTKLNENYYYNAGDNMRNKARSARNNPEALHGGKRQESSSHRHPVTDFRRISNSDVPVKSITVSDKIIRPGP